MTAADDMTAQASQQKPHDVNGFWKTRHTVLMLNFLGLAVSYAIRVNISVAIVDMVNNTAVASLYSEGDSINNSSIVTDPDACPGGPIEAVDIGRKSGEFVWDKQKQGEILAAYYYGYTVGHIPGGLLADRFGGKIIFGVGVLVSSALSILTPLSAWAGDYVLFTNRLAQGLAQGGIIPAVQTLICRWAPDHERSKFAIIYIGMFVGPLVSMASTGAMCETAAGWPLAFYVIGGAGVLWCLPWFLMITDTPAKHPRIDPTERRYIEATIKSSAKKNLPVPWKSILTSPALWALVSLMITFDWTFYLLLTSLPLYIANVLFFDTRSNGLISAIPQITGSVGVLFSGWLIDYVLRKGYISKINGLRIVNGLGTLVPAATFLVVSVVGCNTGVIIALLAINGFCISTNGAGPSMSMSAIAPNYAGTIVGIVNMFANLTGIAVPYVVGAFTSANQTRWAWNSVFYVTAALAAVNYTIYAVFTSADVQPWNEPPPAKESKERSECCTDNAAFECDVTRHTGQRPAIP
ncbi:sialin-like [Schistocerca americana]|uniref:sialin-like n=1 Tax=Schistocerca americana TaxID=7009 RepID=UPI001F4F7C43|nr:sialin-like [Schistocerca americana]